MPNLLTTKDISESKNISTRRVLQLIKSRNVPIAKHAGRSPLIEQKHLKMFDNRKPGNPHKTKR